MASATDFSDSIPGLYDRHLGPVLFEPYAADLVGRLPDEDALRVLELACGTGVVTRRLREALPSSATLVATDLNEPMVSYAREAVAAAGIVWEQADAHALPFEDGSFDVVVCQFGFMFLPDKVQGFREARRVLAPGGILLANIWQSMDANPAAGAMQRALEDLFPEDPPRFLETPYGYCDSEQLRADLVEAGWEEMALESVRLEGASPSAVDFATGFVQGSPLFHALVERGADIDLVARKLAEALAVVGGERPFKVPLAATVITAVR